MKTRRTIAMLVAGLANGIAFGQLIKHDLWWGAGALLLGILCFAYMHFTEP